MTIDTARSTCPSVFDAELPSLTYDDTPNPEDAHRRIRQAREQAPIALGPHGPELLTYDLVRTILRDPRFAMPQGLGLEAQGITSGPLWDKTITGILSLDGAEHHRLRRLVSKAFTPRAVGRLQHHDRRGHHRADRTFDHRRALRRGHRHRPAVPDSDHLRAAGRTPRGLATVLGLDRRHLQDLQLERRQRRARHPARLGTNSTPTSTTWSLSGRHTLTDDLISALIRAEDDGDRLTHDELIMLASTLLAAGTDTTRNQLAATVQVLCDHPDQWALLAEHPELAPQAVEEAMRHSPVVCMTMRKATEDVELGGVVIPAGTLVMANTAAANRDPGVYPDPDRLDITRDGPGAMQTFGGGVHYCLGTHLARLELAEALTVITRRMPNPRRTGPAPWKPLTGMSGPTTLPINFDTGY